MPPPTTGSGWTLHHQQSPLPDGAGGHPGGRVGSALALSREFPQLPIPLGGFFVYNCNKYLRGQTAKKRGEQVPRAKRFLSAAVTVLFSLAFVVISPVHTAPRPVAIITPDGVREICTAEKVVADILAQAGIVLDSQCEITYPALKEELEGHYIHIKRGAPISLKADGETREIITWAGTVEDFLKEQGICVQDALVSYPLEQSLHAGMEVEIIRVQRELVSEVQAIAARTTYKKDSSLDLGKEKVVTQAREGKKLLTYEVIYHDGQEVARNLLSEEVIALPVTGVVLKGTRAAASRGGGSSSNAVEGIASFYGAELHGNKTASGVPFDMNAFTAAHRTLPFGTKVRVTYQATGKSVVVEINDRGPHVAGRIIDLSAAAAREIGLYADGIGKVKIEFLD